MGAEAEARGEEGGEGDGDGDGVRSRRSLEEEEEEGGWMMTWVGRARVRGKEGHRRDQPNLGNQGGYLEH
jgi:hypothetical protein